MRAVLIGCGNHGGEVLLPAALSSGIQVVALVDSDLDRAETLARQWRVGDAYRSLREVGETSAEAAIVALPVSEQASQVAEAMSAGLHVFVEKPPAANPNQLRMLIEHAATTDRICSVGMNFRCADGVQALRDRVLESAAAVTYVRVTQVARKPVAPFGVDLSMEASLFHAQGVHAIDLGLLLAPTATRISGQMVRASRGRMCALVGDDQSTGSRLEASFGSSSAGLYHQLDVFLDTGAMLSLRNLSTLLYLPHGGEPDVDIYPGSRVVWRRSPTTTGYTSAGYAPELATFKAKVLGLPDNRPGALLADLVPVYDAFDQVLGAEGLKWTA